MGSLPSPRRDPKEGFAGFVEADFGFEFGLEEELVEDAKVLDASFGERDADGSDVDLLASEAVVIEQEGCVDSTLDGGNCLR